MEYLGGIDPSEKRPPTEAASKAEMPFRRLARLKANLYILQL